MKNFVYSLVGLAAAASLATADVKTYDWEGSEALADNDPTGISVSIEVGDSGIVDDVNVGLLLATTWQGDIIATLSHGGVTVNLLHRAGDGAGGGFGFSANNFGTSAGLFYLDDEAEAAYDSTAGYGSIADPGIADVTGSWLAYGANGIDALSAFDGMDKQGTWTLTVSDNAAGDFATLNHFQLQIDNIIPAPASAALLAFGSIAATRRRR